MNVLNRVIAILLALALLVLVVVLAVAPDWTLTVASNIFESLAREASAYQQSDFWLYITVRVVFAGAVVVLCLLLLWLEVRRPRKKTIRAQKLAGGEAHIAVDSIALRLAYNIDQLPDVIKVTPRIVGRARGVDVFLLLETSPDIDVPMKTEEVMEVTREVIAERMGLKVGKVTINIKHAPIPKE
jgi:hypothetical protein